MPLGPQPPRLSVGDANRPDEVHRAVLALPQLLDVNGPRQEPPPRVEVHRGAARPHRVVLDVLIDILGGLVGIACGDFELIDHIDQQEARG